jgi:hypothetical protein
MQHKSHWSALSTAVAQIIFLVLHVQLAIYSSLFSVGPSNIFIIQMRHHGAKRSLAPAKYL